MLSLIFIESPLNETTILVDLHLLIILPLLLYANTSRKLALIYPLVK